MRTRITVLCDNAAGPGLECEWGLSLALDLGPERGLWLWDTGQTELFARNARKLGIDIAGARGLALSHGHYDHTGGLAALLAAGFRGRVLAHPACTRKRYALEPDGSRRMIGPPRPLPKFQPAGPIVRFAPGLTFLTDIPRRPGAFEAVSGFSYDPEGREPDTVPDDALLLLESAAGPVVVLGCCHSGLANTLFALRERLGLTRIHAVLGGLHLHAAPPEAVRETAQALREFGAERLIAGHCTGPRRLPELAALLPETTVEPLSAGLSVEF